MGRRSRQRSDGRTRTHAASRGDGVTAAQVRWRALLIALAGAVVYANIFTAPFIFDDVGTVVENAHITGGWSWPGAFGPSPDTALAGRPLAHFSFAVNYALGGLEVGGYHAVNVVLHLVCALLVFGIARRTLEFVPRTPGSGIAPIDIAAAIALLWVVHPLNSEPVAYITQRTESMMAACFLSTLYASVRAHQTARPRRWMAAAVAACLAGAGCKETIAVAPLVVLLYDRTFVYHSFAEAFRRRRAFYACLATVWLAIGALVASGGQSLTAGFESARTTPWTYFLNQPAMLIRYLWLMIWPRSLVLYYGWPLTVALRDVWVPLVLVTTVFAMTVAAVSKRTVLGFLGAFVFLTLGPSSSFVTVATEVAAERRMYLPSIAIIALVVVVIARTTRARPFAAIVLVLFVALSVRTLARNAEYSSALTMARTILERWPTANAHYLVGVELAAIGNGAEALPHLEEAARGYPPAHLPLGSELLKAGRVEEAARALEQFVRDEPTALAARGAHGLLANALTDLGRFRDAIPHYQAYLAAHPTDADAWNGLAVAQMREGQTEAAIGSFAAAARSRPADARLWMNLGRALADRGRVEEARRAFRRALDADPSFAPAGEALRSLGGGGVP